MKIKQNDIVKVVAGKLKGKVAKVVKAYPATGKVALEGVNVIKRNVKPSQLNPKGGTKEVHTAIDVSKVALVVDGKDKTSRVGTIVKQDGTKVRVAKALGNKEIK